MGQTQIADSARTRPERGPGQIPLLAGQWLVPVHGLCLSADTDLPRTLLRTERDAGLFPDTDIPSSRLVRGQSTDLDRRVDRPRLRKWARL